MVYLLDLAEQTRLFLFSLGFGFALGVLYDVFRVVRLLINPHRTRFYLLAQDLLYSVVCTVLCFYFFLAIGDGLLRGYCLLGLILGWLVYYFSLGAVALRSSEWLVRQMRRFCCAVKQIVAAPFLRLLRFLEKTAKPVRKTRIFMKFVKKNLHLGLHSTPGIVYNVGRVGLFKKKEHHRLAQQPPPPNHISETPREPAAQRRGPQAYDEFSGAVGGASVRAFRGIPYSKHSGGNRRGGRAKRGLPAADSAAGGGKPGKTGGAS